MNLAERVGHVVLFPLWALAVISTIVLVAAAYPFVVVYVLAKSEAPIQKRVVAALQWPLVILVFSRFIWIGGFDIKRLAKLTVWLDRRKS